MLSRYGYEPVTAEFIDSWLRKRGRLDREGNEITRGFKERVKRRARRLADALKGEPSVGGVS